MRAESSSLIGDLGIENKAKRFVRKFGSIWSAATWPYCQQGREPSYLGLTAESGHRK